MSYILKNIKQFSTKSTMIFVLFVVCEISAVLIILFSYGTFNHFQTEKDIESKMIDQQHFSISFGNIVDTIKDESGNTLYYNGDGVITVAQFRQVLDKLDDKTKSRLPGFYFIINNEDKGFLNYLNNDEVVVQTNDEDISDLLPFIEFRLEFNENLNDYSLYEEYLNNFYMIKGRFFTYEEYASDKNLIVLPIEGKEELLGETIDFLGKKYTVIGFSGDTGSQVPFKTVGGDNTIKYISILDDNVIMIQDYYKLREAFVSVMGDQVLFPPVNAVDFSEIKFFNSIIYISVALAVVSAINLAILFRYVLNSRRKQLAIFLINGCTRNKLRRMYIIEILIISVTVFLVFSCVYHFVILPKLSFFFDYIAEMYNIRTYISMFVIYLISIYIFLNVVIVFGNHKSPVVLLKKRGR